MTVCVCVCVCAVHLAFAHLSVWALDTLLFCPPRQKIRIWHYNAHKTGLCEGKRASVLQLLQDLLSRQDPSTHTSHPAAAAHLETLSVDKYLGHRVAAVVDVFDLLRGDVLPLGQFKDVLLPVDDFQGTILQRRSTIAKTCCELCSFIMS